MVLVHLFLRDLPLGLNLTKKKPIFKLLKHLPCSYHVLNFWTKTLCFYVICSYKKKMNINSNLNNWEISNGFLTDIYNNIM